MALCAACTASAQTTTAAPPSTTAPVAVGPGLSADSTIPRDIRTLVLTFEQTRNHFLATQDVLRIELSHATTATERQRIRDELQANRAAFLAAQTSAREQLKSELAALKRKISHEEFLRVLDAAHNVGAEGGLSHHKGH
jgi:hypothetical protein